MRVQDMTTDALETELNTLAYARGDCRHEFTYWEPGAAMAGAGTLRPWKRMCTKCRVCEIRFAKVEPSN